MPSSSFSCIESTSNRAIKKIICPLPFNCMVSASSPFSCMKSPSNRALVNKIICLPKLKARCKHINKLQTKTRSRARLTLWRWFGTKAELCVQRFDVFCHFKESLSDSSQLELVFGKRSVFTQSQGRTRALTPALTLFTSWWQRRQRRSGIWRERRKEKQP